MKALIDTDVILDIFLQRTPFVLAASAIWVANEQGRYDAFVSGITPINAFYFVRKQADIAAAQRAVRLLLTMMQVCEINAMVLRAAQMPPITDYEDAVQHASATTSGLDAIVTRNLADYKGATLPVFSPAHFITQLPK
jgi:predicted nucleic acid-binding protein